MTGPSTSSGLLSADTAVCAFPARLRSLIVLADGTNAATVTVYDNASAASGTVLAKWIIKAAETAGSPQLPSEGIIANNGIYVDVSGTGCACIVHYDRG